MSGSRNLVTLYHATRVSEGVASNPRMFAVFEGKVVLWEIKPRVHERFRSVFKAWWYPN